MSDILTRAIIELYNSERFYAEIVLQMDRILSNRVPTAGVCIKDRIQLYVNPDFFAFLTLQEQVATLKHECQHILFDHIPRGKELAPEVYGKKKEDVVDSLINQMKHRAMNVAADCAINCNLPNLPEGGVYPKTFDLQDGETFEWYLENLKDNEKAKQFMKFDDHALWGESEGDKEVFKEKIKQAINKAAERTKAAGNMTSEDQLLVDKLNYKPKDWKSELKRFAARAIEVKLDTSRKRRNRRYGIQYPGVVKVEELHIGVAIDTSGSVPDEALHQFMAEIGNIAKYGKVTVVEADSEVKTSYTFDPKKVYTMSGRGGTAYQPALDYFTNEEEIDGLIYFGDMDAFDEVITKPKYPVLWAIFGDQDPPVDWGSRTKVEIRSNK